jgi:hypothetical protein
MTALSCSLALCLALSVPALPLHLVCLARLVGLASPVPHTQPWRTPPRPGRHRRWPTSSSHTCQPHTQGTRGLGRVFRLSSIVRSGCHPECRGRCSYTATPNRLPPHTVTHRGRGGSNLHSLDTPHDRQSISLSPMPEVRDGPGWFGRAATSQPGRSQGVSGAFQGNPEPIPGKSRVLPSFQKGNFRCRAMSRKRWMRSGRRLRSAFSGIWAEISWISPLV